MTVSRFIYAQVVTRKWSSKSCVAVHRYKLKAYQLMIRKSLSDTAATGLKVFQKKLLGKQVAPVPARP